MLRRGPGRRRAPLPQRGGARGFTQYLTAPVSLRDAIRKRADDADTELAAALDQPGLGTVSISPTQTRVLSDDTSSRPPAGPSSTSAPNWLMSRPSSPLGPGRSRYRVTVPTARSAAYRLARHRHPSIGHHAERGTPGFTRWIAAVSAMQMPRLFPGQMPIDATPYSLICVGH